MIPEEFNDKKIWKVTWRRPHQPESTITCYNDLCLYVISPTAAGALRAAEAAYKVWQDGDKWMSKWFAKMDLWPPQKAERDIAEIEQGQAMISRVELVGWSCVTDGEGVWWGSPAQWGWAGSELLPDH